MKKKKERVKKTLTKKLKEKRVKKRKTVRKRKETTKFLVCCHPTSSFRTTYTKYATSSSSLLYKKGANRDRLRQFENYPNPNARNARPIPYYPQNDRTSVDKTKKKVSQEMVSSLKQNKKESFLPPFKTKKLIKTKISLTNRTKKTLCIILFL